MFGIRKYEFNYEVAPEQAAARLKRSVNAGDNIIGKVSIDAVKLRRRLPFWFRNSFDPIFVGSFSNTDQGAILEGRFRAHWLTCIFMVAFIGISAKNAFETWSAPAQRPGHVQGWRDDRLRFDLKFLGVALLFPVVGWAFGIPSQRAVLKAIEESSNKPFQPIARENARSG
jgi:hypothetical protein